VIDGSGAATLLWQGVVPLLPFAMLLNVRIWRNVCPLGRLSEGPVGSDIGFPGTGEQRPRIGLAILLFASVLPIRAVWLAGSVAATVAFLAVVGGAAVVLGRRGGRRSGFCTTLCPMLPVELLYGQAPLAEVGRGTCESCSLCTARACPQLSPRAAIAQHLGDERHGGGWTRTYFGAFAAAFPGVILAFFVGPTTTLPSATASLVVGAGGAWIVVSLLVALIQPPWDRAILALGFTSIALWAWFASPGVAAAWGWPEGASLIRASGETLAVVWLVHGLRPGRRSGHRSVGDLSRPGEHRAPARFS
jgi:hypothetical protein